MKTTKPTTKRRPGRPATVTEPRVPRSIALTAREWDRLHEIGDGYTAGIRRLLEAWQRGR